MAATDASVRKLKACVIGSGITSGCPQGRFATNANPSHNASAYKGFVRRISAGALRVEQGATIDLAKATLRAALRA